MISLDTKEREKFALYCEQNAEAAKEILNQLELVPGDAFIEMANREKRKIMSFIIVANYLRSAESIGIEDYENGTK